MHLSLHLGSIPFPKKPEMLETFGQTAKLKCSEMQYLG